MNKKIEYIIKHREAILKLERKLKKTNSLPIILHDLDKIIRICKKP